METGRDKYSVGAVSCLSWVKSYNKICQGLECVNKDLKWESPKGLKPNWTSRWIPFSRGRCGSFGWRFLL